MVCIAFSTLSSKHTWFPLQPFFAGLPCQRRGKSSWNLHVMTRMIEPSGCKEHNSSAITKDYDVQQVSLYSYRSLASVHLHYEAIIVPKSRHVKICLHVQCHWNTQGCKTEHLHHCIRTLALCATTIQTIGTYSALARNEIVSIETRRVSR